MIKVLHIIDSLNTGGAEKLLVSTVNGLKGFENHVCSLSEKAELEKELDPACKVIKLGFTSKRNIVRCVRAIRKYIREHDISVVHSHLVMANVIARLATPRRIPLFNTLHSLGGTRFFSSRFGWQRMVEKLTYKKRHFLLAVSNEVLKDYDQAIGVKGQSAVFHNFVSDIFFRNAPKNYTASGRLRAVAVGTLKKAKNYHFVLEALSKVPSSVTLDIYGDGPLKAELEKMIRDNKICNVELKGPKADIEKILPGYDLYLLSSEYEGHPIALLEAMACGLPALVSDIPVLREATGNHSLFFSLTNTDDLVAKLTSILEGRVNIDEYAAYNLDYANSVGRKDQYLKRLSAMYEEAGKVPQ